MTHQTKSIKISACNYNLLADLLTHQTFIPLMFKRSKFVKLSVHQTCLQYGTYVLHFIWSTLRTALLECLYEIYTKTSHTLKGLHHR